MSFRKNGVFGTQKTTLLMACKDPQNIRYFEVQVGYVQKWGSKTCSKKVSNGKPVGEKPVESSLCIMDFWGPAEKSITTRVHCNETSPA